jgi:hypothetical protein
LAVNFVQRPRVLPRFPVSPFPRFPVSPFLFFLCLYFCGFPTRATADLSVTLRLTVPTATPAFYAPPTPPARLNATATLTTTEDDGFDLEDDEQVVLKWTFAIRQGTTTVRTLSGQSVVPRTRNRTVPVSLTTDFNGRNTAGVLLTDGSYGLVLTVQAVLRADDEDEVLRTATSGAGSVVLDRIIPTISASVTPQANAAGWHKSAVTVTFTCADTGSGIATCPAPRVVTTDGANQAISGTAVDKAGNTATTAVTLNLDRTTPSLQAVLTPTANAVGGIIGAPSW